MAVGQIALIGSRGHWDAVSREIASIPGLKIVALSPGGDSVEPVAAWCANHGHEPTVEQDYRAMLDRARPDMPNLRWR
jgi:hypothetical protein